MKFEELDAQMRVFETAQDSFAAAAHWVVARVDGRNFTRLTKETCDFEAPFDPRFHSLMVETTKHLMACGFRTVYAYTQSDEISILLHPEDRAFERKTRKLISILAAEAVASFSSQLGHPAAFDCRLSQFTETSDVVNYFRWRQEDARRNALNAHCYWALRKSGVLPSQAADETRGFSLNKKVELLKRFEIDFERIPAWQRLGAGAVWKTYEVSGKNPMTGEMVPTERRQIQVLLELEQGTKYGAFVSSLLGVKA